jgi:hypothetical protein
MSLLIVKLQRSTIMNSSGNLMLAAHKRCQHVCCAFGAATAPPGDGRFEPVAEPQLRSGFWQPVSSGADGSDVPF